MDHAVKRIAVRLTRMLAAAASAGMLIACAVGYAQGQPAPSPAECACPAPTPASALDFWPDRSQPGIPGAVVEYRLTPAYWAAFAKCRTGGCAFGQCAHGIPVDYVVVRVR